MKEELPTNGQNRIAEGIKLIGDPFYSHLPKHFRESAYRQAEKALSMQSDLEDYADSLDSVCDALGILPEIVGKKRDQQYPNETYLRRHIATKATVIDLVRADKRDLIAKEYDLILAGFLSSVCVLYATELQKNPSVK